MAHLRSTSSNSSHASLTRNFPRGSYVLLGSALLLFSLVFGGGGSPAEGAELAVQLAALIVIGALVVFGHGDRIGITTVFKRDRLFGSLIAALLALFILQLVPLPPQIWQSLPGREAMTANAVAAGAGAAWLPMSISPWRTLASLLSLIPPLAAYMWASGTKADERDTVFLVLLVFLPVSIFLQALQTTGSFFLYSQTQTVFTAGFHANRNAQADLIAIGMLIFAFRVRGPRPATQFHAQQVGLFLVLLVAMVLTGSRAGMGMAALSAIVFAVRMVLDLRSSRKRNFGTKTIIAGGGAFLSVLLLFLWFAEQSTVVQRTIGRFDMLWDPRFDIVWPDAVYAVEQFFPFGAGLGTFVPAYQLFESTETLIPAIVNRAHNDFLEIAVEAGIFGMAIAAFLIIAIFWRMLAILRLSAKRDVRARAVSALVITAIIALHSLVDYPLRAMSIAVVLASWLGLLAADWHERRVEPE